MIEIRYARGFWPDIHRFDNAIRKDATPYEDGVFSEWERIIEADQTNPERLQRAYWCGAQSDQLSIKAAELVIDTQVVLQSVPNLVWHRGAFNYGYIHIGNFVFSQRFSTAKPGLFVEQPGQPAIDKTEFVWSDRFARVSKADQAIFYEQMKIGAEGINK